LATRDWRLAIGDSRLATRDEQRQRRAGSPATQPALLVCEPLVANRQPLRPRLDFAHAHWRAVNLPNAITVVRIAMAPGVAVLALAPFWPLRLLGFALFVGVAATDYVDGKLARDRNLVTNLGRLLDPLADKVLLVSALLPMYILQGPGPDGSSGAALMALPAAWRDPAPFVTPMGTYGLPLWVVLTVLGREVFMTAFRQAAAWRGVVIAAIGSAKLKTGFQWTWIGAAFFWFAALRAAQVYGWQDKPMWRPIADFIGVVGVVTMVGAVSLTLYSLAQYLRRYGGLFAHRADHNRG
jgi:CDP-diacylglycerol---glycerol-3-phosphate 3-phosphatidyltransferase